MAAARATSALLSPIGLPTSRAISSASSSAWDSRRSAALLRTAPRSEGRVAFHPGAAFAAASMARSASALPDLGVVPRTSEGSAGFVISYTSPESAGTHSPPMKFLASIWDSIMVCLLDIAHGSLSPFLPAPVGSITRRRSILSRHLVLEYQLADRDLDVVPRREAEVFAGHEAGARHQEGPYREGEFLTEVARQLFEGALHPRGAHLVFVENLSAPQDAHPDGEVTHGVGAAQNDT